QMAVRAMRVFAAVLVVAAAYSIVQTQFRRSAQTNAALAASAEAGGITPTLPEASASTAASAIQSVKLTAPVPSRSTRVPLAPSRVISPAMPLSHRQVT